MMNEAVYIDMLIRLTALENILVDKGIMTKEALQEEYVKYQVIIAKRILSDAGINNVDSIIEELQKGVDNS